MNIDCLSVDLDVALLIYLPCRMEMDVYADTGLGVS